MFSFRKPSQLLGEMQAYWILLTLLFPGLGTAVSVIWAALLHVPGYLILFYGSGIFCFLIVAMERLSTSIRDNTIFGKLQTVGFNPVFGTDLNNNKLVNCYAVVQNRSRFDIYYKIETADLSLDGRTFPPGTQTEVSIMMIPAGSSVSIGFASIMGLEPKAMVGDMKLKLAYGKKKNSFAHIWEVLAEPQVNVGRDPSGKIVGTAGMLRFKDVKFS